MSDPVGEGLTRINRERQIHHTLRADAREVWVALRMDSTPLTWLREMRPRAATLKNGIALLVELEMVKVTRLEEDQEWTVGVPPHQRSFVAPAGDLVICRVWRTVSA